MEVQHLEAGQRAPAEGGAEGRGARVADEVVVEVEGLQRGERAGAEALVLALTECRQPESGAETWRTAADVAHLQVADSCTSCHRAYRN